MTSFVFFPHLIDNCPVISVCEMLLLFGLMSLLPYNLGFHYLFPTNAQLIFLFFLKQITSILVVENIVKSKESPARKYFPFNIMQEKTMSYLRK